MLLDSETFDLVQHIDSVLAATQATSWSRASTQS